MVEPCGFTASKSKVRTILELTHSEGVVAEQRVDNRRLEFVTVGGSRIKPSRVVVSLCSTIVTFTWMVTLEWTSTLLGGAGGGWECNTLNCFMSQREYACVGPCSMSLPFTYNYLTAYNVSN